jgi:ribosomal protein L40E
LNADNGSWTLTVDRPYVVSAVWSFDVFPIIGLTAGAALSVGIVVIAVVLARRRGISRGPTMGQTTTAPAKTTGTQICKTCGNTIPITAGFCQKCGTPIGGPQRPRLEDTVYDYIVKHDGVISLSKASKDLGVSVDKLKEATENLKKEGRLA